MSDLKCTNCRYGLCEDNGYSNYTVMGTDFSCLKDLHPDGTFDLFYGEREEFLFANKCDNYSEGKGIHLDVDIEYGEIENYTSDSELIDLYNSFKN